jgi:hypothetical protein
MGPVLVALAPVALSLRCVLALSSPWGQKNDLHGYQLLLLVELRVFPQLMPSPRPASGAIA